MPEYLTEPRGKPIAGARALAAYLFDDPDKTDGIYNMTPETRARFGLIELNGKVTGFQNWIDAGIRASVGGKRRQRETSAA
jgi:hypothetical protein